MQVQNKEYNHDYEVAFANRHSGIIRSMKYFITALATIIIVGLLVYSFPKSLDFNSDFYDRFYSQEKKESRILERDIALIPENIGRLALSDPTERGVGISVKNNCELNNKQICSKDIRVEYKNYINDFYAVNISNYSSIKDYANVKDIIINLSLNKNPDQEFFVFEKHEIGWFSENKKAFILVQKGVCESTNNQPETCKYPYEIMKDDLIVARFKEIYN